VKSVKKNLTKRRRRRRNKIKSRPQLDRNPKSGAVIEEVSDNRQIENVGNGFQTNFDTRERDPLL
jgi:hypothetical protein